MKKICTSCKTEKVLEVDFYKQPPSRRTNGGGYLHSCKECVLKRNRKSSQKNKKRIWENKLKYRYGITVEEYKKLLESQGRCCSICKTKNPSQKRKQCNYFCVDHCHETGKVRGLLCSTCNTALGLLGDSRDNLVEAINYLTRFEDSLLSSKQL
jgi:hypothetical protein